MNVMVLEGMNALGAMEKAKKNVPTAMEEGESNAPLALAMVVKDALRVVEREWTPGITLVAPVVMDVAIRNAMTVMEVARKSVVCVGGVAMKTVHLVMDVVMMIVTSVMDMGNCVWNVTDAMAMAS